MRIPRPIAKIAHLCNKYPFAASTLQMNNHAASASNPRGFLRFKRKREREKKKKGKRKKEPSDEALFTLTLTKREYYKNATG